MTIGSRSLVGRLLIGMAGIGGLLFILVLAVFGGGLARNFHVPSEGMAPTLENGDRFVARTDGPGDPKRGEIVIFPAGRGTYVQRVAAVPGDRIAMKDGIVILNGRPVVQRLLGEEMRSGTFGPVRARRLAERFPGELGRHEILDLGPSEFDDMEERRIPPGFLFVLGDNRDRSADSRVPRAHSGVELLPVTDVRGRPVLQTWPWGKAGRRFR